MNVERDDLARAAAAGLITEEQAATLWAALRRERAFEATTERRGRTSRFAPLTLLLAAPPVAALVWALVLAWERFGGAGTLALGGGLGVALVAAGRFALPRSPLAAGVLLTAAVAMVPLAVSGALHAAGAGGAGAAPYETLSGWALSHHFPAALATLGVAALVLRAFRLPILSAVFAAAACLTAMGAAPIVFGGHPSWEQHALLAILLGAGVLAVGFAADGRTGSDHAGALYLVGLVVFAGGLAAYRADGGPALALGALAYAALVLTSLLVARRAFATFGAVGLAGLAGRVASAELVEEAVPFALLAVGVAVAAAALAYLRFERRWRRWLVARFPAPLRGALPPGAHV